MCVCVCVVCVCVFVCVCVCVECKEINMQYRKGARLKF